MFYSQFILAKKGPLGTIWIAAHLERKLRKNQVAETDIGVTVDNILFPEVPIALRLSGHLLLGVVRIYSRQVNYLFNDCSETLGKIKQAFHAAAVDLPPEATTAPFHSITLPETFDFDELELAPDSETAFLYSKGKYVDHHVTTREQITLQDCIENNPYLGSSQFGLDERFGDGNYSSLGLDFDEEFWASKAGSSSLASTSTPLLKEDIVLPAGGENEVIHMDVEDPYQQPLELERQKDTPMTEAVNTEAGQTERDEQLNMSIPAISAAPFNEPSGFEMTSSKDSDFAALKNDAPSFHVYTPRVLEACTPDLNQEYCPPDEPSTPALADETSLAVYKECNNAESAGRLSPVRLGNTEKSSSGLLPVSSSPQQVPCVNTLASSMQAARSSSPASFQGFPLQQTGLSGTNRDAFLSEKEKGQLLVSKENAASASMTFQSFPQLTTMQQTSTPVSREGAVFQTGASSSSSTTSESSVSSLGQRDGNSLMTANQQLAGVVNQEPYPRFQHQGLAAGSQTPLFSSAAMVEPTATVNREVYERVQQQGLAAGSQSSGSSFGAVSREAYERVQQQGLAVGSQNSGSSFGAVVGLSGTINHGVHAGSQQQGLAVGPSNPVSAFGAMTGSAGTVNQETYPSFQQQGLAVGSQNPVSSLSSSGAVVGSADTVLHKVRASSQQQGLAEGSSNQVSSFGALAGSTGTGIQETYPSFQQQGLALGSQKPVSSLSTSGALGESIENVNHGVRASSQQQGLTVGSSNSVSSFGAMGGSAGTGNQGTHPSIQQQGLELATPNPVSLLSASGAAIGSTEIVNHGVHASSQQEGLAVGSLNQVSSFGATAGSARTGNQVTFPSSQHQGLAAASLNPASSLSTSGAMVGSTEIGNHGVHASSQQQGLAIGSSNPVSSFGAIAGSVGTKNQGTYPSFQQPGLAVTPPNPVSSLSASGAMVGLAETVNYGVHASSRQQGLAVGSPNPVSSFGARAGAAGTGNQGTYTNFQQQGLAAASLNPVSSLSESGAMVGLAEVVNHGVHASSQQQGPAIGSPNPVSSFGAMAGLAGTGNQGAYASLQQQGCAVTSLNPVSSSSSFGAIAGSVGAVNHGVHASSQQQGLAGGLSDSVSSFGAMAGLAGTSNRGTYPSFQQQGLAKTSPNPVSPLSSFGANVGLPATVNHGAHASSQQQGLAVGAPNPVSSFGAMAGSTGTGNQGTHPSFQQQGLAAAAPNPVASLSSSGAMAGSAGTVNHIFHISSQQQGFAVGSQSPVSSFGDMVKSSDTVNQGAYASFQQQGLAVGSQNPVPSFGAAVESTFSHPSTTMRNIGASQVLASPVVSQASITPLFSPSSGSPLPVTNVLPSSHLESMNSRKERAHESLDSAALKGPFRPSVTQQLSIPSPTAMPGISSSMRYGERETLRSAYDLHSGSPGFLMLQNDMSVERIPGLELQRNKSFSVGTDGFNKEATRPAMDRTPIWREETPYSYTRAPFMSAHSIDSIPADDDVLASILGRRNKDFKVVPTPKAPKEPKVNAAKRPKRAPRVTPKKRKIDIDAVAVLHGDVIRQQLANAEDIRRDRRKAPCTRREVWAFIRESEGQENFDEPTLPELSHDLHDLYHDVLHGPESRASASVLNGAVKANQLPEAQLIRSGETDSLLVNGMNNDASKLVPRGDSDHLVVGTTKDPSRDAFMNEFPRNGENNSAEGYAEQLNRNANLAVAQTHAGGSLIQIEDAEKLSAKDLFKAGADSEGMARKESDRIALPESQGPENYNFSSFISRETEANQQAKQTLSLEREVEAPGPAQNDIIASNLSQNDIIASNLSQNVVGVVGADEGIAMAVQREVLGAVGGDEAIAMTVQKDVLGAVGGDEGIAMTVHKDALGAVGGDGGVAMTAPQDVLGAVGIAMTAPQNVHGALGGDGGIAMMLPQNVFGAVGVAMTEPQNVRGALGGDGVIAMTLPQNVFGDVGGDGGIGMGVQQDVLGVVGGHGGVGMGVPQDVLGVVGGDGGIGMTTEKDVLGVVSEDVGNQEREMAMQHDTDRVEEKQQFSFGVHEHELTLIGKEADFKPLDIPSDGNHLTEVPMSDGKVVSEVPLLNVVHIDHGNMEGSDKKLDVDRANLEGTDKLPTSTEEETNLFKDDEDMAAMDCEKDTDFLDDDNDVAFAEIDYSSDEQDASIQDSNGWSARSRNVGRYLKTTFEEMEGNLKRLEQPTLVLERLLARKTRREAARMFFETLVLKTKDYIHVEQNVAYQDIHLYPKSKLMKTEF